MTEKFYEPLLVAEDSDEDFVTLQRLMRQLQVQNPIYRCEDGDSVLEFLARIDQAEAPDATKRPSVILLDLNLPGTDGRDVLEQLKQDQSLREIPVVIFTTSSNPKDIEFCYRKGANGYLVKPMDIQELQRTVQAFVEYWLEANTSPNTPVNTL